MDNLVYGFTLASAASLVIGRRYKDNHEVYEWMQVIGLTAAIAGFLIAIVS